jgi:hypothetical protein
MRVAAGLFRLWVVLSLLWLAAAGAYTIISYQDAPRHDLINGRPAFADLIPAYEQCWSRWRTSESEGEDWVRVEDLPQVAECERVVDRWQIVRDGLLIALSIPIVVLIVGWGFVWAARGFLPALPPS